MPEVIARDDGRLPMGARAALRLQRTLGLLCFPVLGGLAVLALLLRGYRIRNAKAIRAQFKRISAESRGPFIVCANHLTMVDSVLIDWALASNWTYCTRFRHLPWNIPELDNFSGSLGLRLLCYLFKCMPFRRKGSKQAKTDLFDRLGHLLRQGQAVCIFPEGKRSRDGRLDTTHFTYGVGLLANRAPQATVLCIYLRGTSQSSYSTVPERDQEFHVELRPIRPQSTATGLRAARALSVQVMDTLQHMEDRYFAVYAEDDREPQPAMDRAC